MSDYSIGVQGIYTHFHSGRLAAVSYPDRMAYQIEHAHRRPSHGRLLYRSAHSDNIAQLKPTPTKAPAGSSLVDCLSGCTVDTLKDMAHSARIDYPRSFRKPRLAEFMAYELPKTTSSLKKLLAHFGHEPLDLVKSILNGQHIMRGTSHASSQVRTFPYLFAHTEGDNTTWFIPTELRDMFKEADFNAIADKSHTNEEISRLLHLFAALGGIAKISDVYEAYCQFSHGEACDEKTFSDLAVRIASEPGSAIDTKHCGESNYVVFTRRYARRQQVCNNSYYANFDGFGYDYELERRCITSSISTNEEELIKRHEGILPFASTETMLGKEADEFVYDLPSVQALTHYFDAHVPEYKDDFFFADAMIDELINDIMLCRCSLASVLAGLTKDGWYLSEGSNIAPLLTKLVLDLYRELPRWDLNGWSEIAYADMQGLPYFIGESWLATEDLPLTA